MDGLLLQGIKSQSPTNSSGYNFIGSIKRMSAVGGTAFRSWKKAVKTAKMSNRGNYEHRRTLENLMPI